MRNRVLLFVAGASLIGGLMIGLGIGLSQAKTEIVEKTVEVEKRVEVTPPACIEALDLAADGLGYSADFAGITSEAFMAIADFNFEAFQPLLDKMDAITEKVTALTPQLGPLSSECRAAA